MEKKNEMLAKGQELAARQLKRARLQRVTLEERQEELEKLATDMKPTIDNNIYLTGQVVHELELACNKLAEVKACVQDVQKQAAVACASYRKALGLALAKAKHGDAEQIKALRAVGKPLAGLATVAGSSVEAMEQHAAKAMEYAKRAEKQAIDMGILRKSS